MRLLLVVLVCALGFPAALSAQSPPLVSGSRVRITSPADDLGRHVTTVTDVRGDSIVITAKEGSRTIALRNATAIDVSVGTRRPILRNGLIGLGAGAVVGAALGAIAYEECNPEEFCFLPGSRGGDAALGAVVVGAAGFLTGAIIGAFQ